ncbi:MAG: precorrin-6A synthase (deacetylating) [Alphaproteobacteria bacterium]|nr:precorrin-6A synthase (deacetylating) [Alphaproteobacteria bacterium]MCB9931769.1 precorrin-6A synthase (deacetylating) [Alphaproteobacteria bacterium]
MIDLRLIGVGTGNPEHLTLAAVEALNGADLILIPRKGPEKADLADLRHRILAKVLSRPVPVAEFDMPVRADAGDYLMAVERWHAEIARAWTDVLSQRLPDGGRAALLVWGDPSLYDSTLRIAGRLQADGLPLRVSVVPGITSLQLLTAAHAVPLNGLGQPVVITTGRWLRRHGWPEAADRVAVMLDAGGAYRVLDPQGVHIWWGAALGLPQQALIAGPLAAVADRIGETRARLRAAHGWVMDIYLLSRAGLS